MLPTPRATARDSTSLGPQDPKSQSGFPHERSQSGERSRGKARPVSAVGMHHKRHGGQQTLQALTRTRGGAKQGIKQRAPPIRRMLPVMLLAMLSLYGIWFFRAATENRDPAVPGVRSDEEGPRIVAQAAAVEEGARIVAKAAAVSPPRPPAPQALSAGTATSVR